MPTKLPGSWNTTILGIGALLSALGLSLQAVFDVDPTTIIDTEELIATIVGLVGILAKEE